MNYYIVPKHSRNSVFQTNLRDGYEGFETVQHAIRDVERRFQEDSSVWHMTIYIVAWDFEPVIVKTLRFADIKQFPLYA